MIDDPLALAVQLIAVLAAGMYPIGFLFGTCSDCCCPGCDYCSAAYMDDGNILNFSAATLEFGNQSVRQERAEFTTGGNDHPISLASFGCGDHQFEIRVGIDASSVGFAVDVDECGCERAVYLLTFRVLILRDGDRLFEDTVALYDSVSNGQTIIWDFCKEPTTTRVMRWFDEAELDWYDSWPYDVACHPAELEGATLDVTLEWDYVCECGACCRNSHCEDNVSDSWCESLFWGNEPGEWQGVGTTCDPDPCT